MRSSLDFAASEARTARALVRPPTLSHTGCASPRLAPPQQRSAGPATATIRVVAQVLRRPDLAPLRNPSGRDLGQSCLPQPVAFWADVGALGRDLARHEIIGDDAGFRSSIVVLPLRNSTILTKRTVTLPCSFCCSRSHCMHCTLRDAILPVSHTSPFVRRRIHCSAVSCT